MPDNQSNLARMRRRFEMTAGRLVKLIELKAPDLILANEILLLYKCAAATFPEQFAFAHAEFLFRPLKVAGGICPKCGNDMDPAGNSTSCMACEFKTEMKAEEEGWNEA